MKCHMFVGPTAFGLPQNLLDSPDIVLHAPIERGHLPELYPALQNDDVIAIVDGRFGEVLSVGHWEILQMLDAGLPVWGLSSMGAIRAAELSIFGMLPYGAVARFFIDDPNFKDDEVTLLHSPIPPYQAISEPLVHLRACLAYLENTEFLNKNSSKKILDQLKNSWFGDRTWTYFYSLLSLHGVPEETLQILRTREHRFRLKTDDLEQFIQKKPWVHRR